MEEKLAAPKKNKISFVPAVTFLCLEVLAFVAFSLANSFLLYSILSLVLSVIFIFIYLKQLKIQQFSPLAYFLFPLVMFGILSALSPFARYELSLVEIIFIPISLITFAFNGYMVGYSEKFTIRKALIVIYSAIAIYTLINLFITMLQFVPFYAFTYGNVTIYYDGEPSSVRLNEMAYALMGFSLKEVSTRYFSLFPTMLLTAVIPLFHISFKKDRKSFLIFASFVFVGLLTIVLAISKYNIFSTLFTAIILTIIALVSKGILKAKYLKIPAIAVGAALSIFFVIFFLNAQPWEFIQPFRHFIQENKLLNFIFNGNNYSSKFVPILSDLFSRSKFLGFPNNAELFIYLDGVDQIAFQSGSWFMDNFMTSGIIGSAFFIMILVIAIRKIMAYCRFAKDSVVDKSLLIAFISTYFLYTSYTGDGLPMVFSSKSEPIYTQGLFLIVIFLIAYICKNSTSPVKEEVKEAITNENK